MIRHNPNHTHTTLPSSVPKYLFLKNIVKIDQSLTLVWSNFVWFFQKYVSQPSPFCFIHYVHTRPVDFWDIMGVGNQSKNHIKILFWKELIDKIIYLMIVLMKPDPHTPHQSAHPYGHEWYENYEHYFLMCIYTWRYDIL